MGDDHILVVINLDPFIRHSAFVHVPLEHFGLTPEQGYQMHDLLTDRRYLWYGSKNYVELDPQAEPAHVFVLRK
jgi:starch synthase (maltosyl-transferring)